MLALKSAFELQSCALLGARPLLRLRRLVSSEQRGTQEIISYFQPKHYWIENPQTGRMNDYMTDYKHTDVCYCMYGFDYKKPTRIWRIGLDYEVRSDGTNLGIAPLPTWGRRIEIWRQAEGGRGASACRLSAHKVDEEARVRGSTYGCS